MIGLIFNWCKTFDSNCHKIHTPNQATQFDQKMACLESGMAWSVKLTPTMSTYNFEINKIFNCILFDQETVSYITLWLSGIGSKQHGVSTLNLWIKDTIGG